MSWGSFHRQSESGWSVSDLPEKVYLEYLLGFFDYSLQEVPLWGRNSECYV